MRNALSRLPDVVAGIWFLSWFALYLEIYRYHHVVLGHIADVLSPPASATAAPGEFVRTVVLCSLLSPPLLIALWALLRITSRRSGALASPRRTSRSTPILLAVFGGVLAVLGVLNQGIRHPPFLVDLTLRSGNGGFVVLGLILGSAGLVLRHWRHRDLGA